ncbi:hypothetical protein IF1G_01770 [Cordyceps javanica]|uniref:Tat pathway signal sequence n=1 Tax=Cordyceps javanica TaxID=43265 RepID=A0A545VCV1_9HYPO|nr:hypothetical protein IF1G_01770 [Cordyceps javanica]TQW10772.1 hypothetical protein IF2G_01714 [Cordyceps javanica]
MNQQGEPPSRRRKLGTVLLILWYAMSIVICTYSALKFLSETESSASGGNSLATLLRRVRSSSRMAVFSEHHNYTSLDHDFDWLWENDLLTPNGGYLTADKKTHNTDKLGISMFHQLHCLGMIREEMQHLHHVIEASRARGSAYAQIHQMARRHSDGVDLDSGRPAHHDEEHTMHCFDYLRQTMLCLADSTVERPGQLSDGKPYINGMGQRKCRNWELLYAASTRSDSEPMSDDEL